MSTAFDFTPLLPAGLPAPAMKWTGSPKYNFTGGNNDSDELPLDELVAAADAVLKREGRTLATYGLASGPQGYRPLRDFLVQKLKRDAGIACTADEILVTSGSLQALDLVSNSCVNLCSKSKVVPPSLSVDLHLLPESKMLFAN